MKEYVLNYYPFFKCVGSECKHTCCAGWKMNIDSQSLGFYKADDSSFSQALKNGVNFKKSRFRADKNERCAFLNEKGLCEIIINLGEQSLCQVCRDHPRFRSFFNDRTEIGLGFCCEEATKIVLSFNDNIQPVLASDDGEREELDFIQKTVLDFREKVIKVVQDESLDINRRIDAVLSLCNAQVECKNFAKIIKAFFSFERLDKDWTVRLKKAKKSPFLKNTSPSLARYAEQFLVNSLYRHLSDSEDVFEARARAVACVLGWWLINGIFEQERVVDENNFYVLVDVVRAYSAEVEYSQKNLDKLFAFAYKFIKI